MLRSLKSKNANNEFSRRKPPDMPEKKTERLTIWLPESLVNDLARMAHDDNRKLGDFITLALSRYAYGHRRPAAEIDDVAIRGDSHQ